MALLCLLLHALRHTAAADAAGARLLPLLLLLAAPRAAVCGVC